MKELVTDRLLLRNWGLYDSKDLYEYAQSELVGPNAGWKPHKSEEESRDRIKMFIQDKDVYAIELRSERKLIGSIGIHDMIPVPKNRNRIEREIGFVLNPSYWGNGYMREAVEKVLELGFTQMKLDTIWCGHFIDNIRSKRVIEKCGFIYKFTKKQFLPLMDNKSVLTKYYNINVNRYLK